MQLVPVIDLKAGQVVRAYLGRRDHYAPLVTPLAPTSAATDVVEGFLRLFPFPALYVADLDAIDGRGTNQGVIEELSAAFPRQRFWLDAGLRDAAGVRALLEKPQIDPVIGAESLASFDVPVAIYRRAARNSVARLSRVGVSRPASLAGDAEPVAGARDRHDIGAGRRRHGAGPRDFRARSRRAHRTSASTPPAARATRATSTRCERPARKARWSRPCCTSRASRRTTLPAWRANKKGSREKRLPRNCATGADYSAAAKGCLAVTRAESTLCAVGSPFIARAMASFVAV